MKEKKSGQKVQKDRQDRKKKMKEGQKFGGSNREIKKVL